MLPLYSISTSALTVAGTSFVVMMWRQKSRLVTKLAATEAELARVNEVKYSGPICQDSFF